MQLRHYVELQEELAINYCKLAVVSVDSPVVNDAFRTGLRASFPFLSDHGVPVGLGCPTDRTRVDGADRLVHPDVHVGDRLFVGDIGDERYRIGAFSGELSCSALGCFGVDIDNRQLRAFTSEALSNRAADAAPASGDDHDPAVDSSHCRLYLSDK